MSPSALIQVPLHTVADVIDPHPSHRAPGRVNQGIPFVGIGDLSKNTHTSFPNARMVSRSIFDEHAARYDLQEGLLGLGRVASVGLVVDLPIPDLDSPYVVSPTLAIIKAKSIDKAYLKFQLMSPQVQLQLDALKQGSGRESVGVQKLRNVLIHLPPLDEQRRIVETLDEHLSRLGKALADLEHVDTQTLVLRRSILNEKLNPESHASESSSEPLTELPSGWVSTRLGDLAQVTMGQSPPGSSYNKHAHGTPFFQGKAEFGEKHPTVRQWTTAATKFAEPGDILMSVRAPVGPTNIADAHCAIGRGLAGIRAGASLDQSYLIWYLKHVEASIQERGKGTTFDAISGNDLRDTIVNLPTLDEQRRIVETLNESLSRLDSTRYLVASQKASLQALRRSLLNKAFNGELGIS